VYSQKTIYFSNHKRLDRTFGPVVAQLDPPDFEEADEFCPLLATVVHHQSEKAVGQDSLFRDNSKKAILLSLF
jgi:hypothetical protein